MFQDSFQLPVYCSANQVEPNTANLKIRPSVPQINVIYRALFCGMGIAVKKDKVIVGRSYLYNETALAF